MTDDKTGTSLVPNGGFVLVVPPSTAAIFKECLGLDEHSVPRVLVNKPLPLSEDVQSEPSDPYTGVTG